MLGSKERILTIGDVVKSPQFAYITYQLERNKDANYTIDNCKLIQIGYAANPMTYYDDNGVRHEIVHSGYMPELAEHKFRVVAVSGERYFLTDLTNGRDYFIVPAPYIHLIYVVEQQQ